MMSFDFKAILLKHFTPRVLCGVLGLLIVAELMFGLKTYFTEEAIQIPARSVPNLALIVPIPREEILKMPLFGEFLPEDLAGVELKNSTLHLKLLGVLFSEDEQKSAVIIELSGGEQRIYHVGDTLPGGAVVQRINPDEIYVSRNGGVEYLFLPEKGINLNTPQPGITFEK
jgi:general secretion pathway protein C